MSIVRTLNRRQESLALIQTHDGKPYLSAAQSRLLGLDDQRWEGMLHFCEAGGAGELGEPIQVTVLTADALRADWAAYLQPPIDSLRKPRFTPDDWQAVQEEGEGVRSCVMIDDSAADDEWPIVTLHVLVDAPRLDLDVIGRALFAALLEHYPEQAVAFPLAWDVVPTAAYAAAEVEWLRQRASCFTASCREDFRMRRALLDLIYCEELLPARLEMDARRLADVPEYLGADAEEDAEQLDAMLDTWSGIPDTEAPGAVAGHRDAARDVEMLATLGDLEGLRAELDALRPAAALDPAFNPRRALAWLAAWIEQLTSDFPNAR